MKELNSSWTFKIRDVEFKEPIPICAQAQSVGFRRVTSMA